MFSEVTELSESPMRFFTPELFLRVNSNNDEIADAAQDEWEQSAQAYRHHLKKVLRHAPRSVGELAEACFHDAVVSGMTFDSFGRDAFSYQPAGRIPPVVPRPSPATIKLTPRADQLRSFISFGMECATSLRFRNGRNTMDHDSGSMMRLTKSGRGSACSFTGFFSTAERCGRFRFTMWFGSKWYCPNRNNPDPILAHLA